MRVEEALRDAHRRTENILNSISATFFTVDRKLAHLPSSATEP